MTLRTTTFESADVHCWHTGDGALCVTMTAERPSITADVLVGFERALALAESEFQMLIIGAEQKDFGYGADLGDSVTAAAAGNVSPLDRVLDHYQQTMLALRHARVPTIAVTRGVAISGACEVLMHCARVVAAPKSPIGLVETSIGVLPGGGGVKEMAWRAAARANRGNLTPALERAFDVLAAARIVYARGAAAVDLLTAQDVVSDAADLVAVAKDVGQSLQRAGYRPPPRHPTIRIAGADGLAHLRTRQQDAMNTGALTAHQLRVNDHLAQVLCGGEVPCREVTEATLLDLERHHFVTLAQMPDTQARLAHLRATGTVLRN
jgi:3-hydroxyacyl-CoA dehydrogenase